MTIARTLLVVSAVLALSIGTPARADDESRDRQIQELKKQVEDLKTIVYQLQKQVTKRTASPKRTAVVQARPARQATPAAPPAQPATPVVTPAQFAAALPQAAPPPTAAATPSATDTVAGTAKSIIADTLRGMTFNVALDTYYEYNTNHPIGRVNYLRAYDVSADSFSLNQADVVVESAPDPANNKPYGLRLDLQYGQATATLQGNPANELRPEVYRPIYQAYGTYVIPLGNGLTVDFGKWASSLGMEGNYTKDQLNYSRSFWFDYLPFYHTGLRAKYPLNDAVTFNLWIVNGTQESEADNNYKDQLYGVVYTPSPDFTWTFNFYHGQEHPDVVYLQNPIPGLNLPSQQGTYIEPIANAPSGMLNIGDTYATWQATPELLFGLEGDYTVERYYTYSSPQHVYGGAVYSSYQILPQLDIAFRGEYLADHGGLFSGVKQDLKEGTLTLDYRPAGDGFLVDLEYRRDWSNAPYFLSNTLNVLEHSQPTIGVGLVWWFGQKQGAW